VSQITLNINDRSYDMSCDDGQESHLQGLAEYVDKQVQGLASSVGQVGEARLLVMTSLMIADSLHDAYRELSALKVGDGEEEAGREVADAAAAEALNACVQRIEAIAERLSGH
jgi:cell division protein ZapA